MNTSLFSRLRLILIVVVLATVALRGSATVFTQDTYIGPLDTNYDGQDLVVLGCTVTVDGPHTFSSVVLAANGFLTHSFFEGGLKLITLNVTNEPLVLSGTTPSTVGSNLFNGLLVMDPTQTITYTYGVDYLEINQTNANVIYTDIERTTNSSIPDGGTVLVSYSDSSSVPAGLDLTVTGVVWVTAGCEIDADDIGYGAGFGPGAGTSSSNMFFFGSGGGHGGSGGMSLSNAVGGVCYDSLYVPSLPGSGGGSSYAGSGGNGGGLVQITASDEMVIDGVISANGENATNSRSGGGSGGGIWISAPSLSGAGSIMANGGLGAPDYGGGGGGGGRITIVCGTNNFSGTITAYGGGGANYGGAGTVFTELTGAPGLLTLNNNGTLGASSTVTLFQLADVAVSNGAVVAVTGSFSPQNLTIGTNSVLTGQQTTPLEFSVSNLTITAGGTMSVNGLGFSGEGVTYTTGGVTYGGGGGHGGPGGAAAVTNAVGGIANDSQTDPIDPGTGGGGATNGGAGGGAINVNIIGALQVDGLISANATSGTGLAGGGGAGGSIYLTAGTFSGNGTVTANGGTGANLLGGGGGGGRIAIFANSYTFGGAIDCFGGAGGNYGGAGTVFLSQNGAWQNLVLDNGGNTGPSTPLQTSSTANLFVQDGAWGTLPTGSTFSNLLVTSNAWVTAPASSTETIVTILSNAVFQAGGGLTLNSDGSPSFQVGHGGTAVYTPYAGGGGGNGGTGGAGNPSLGIQETIAYGGPAGFNSPTSPTEQGGNGGGESPYSIGATGGGTIRLTVDGVLQVDGVIMANGGNGSGEGGGGGAGGSLALSAGIFAGSGSITVNGGNGVDSTGGGGGGGCIAITFNTNDFIGTLSAFGGTGANNGGAGIIYYKTNSFVNGQIIVDNGGVNGANSVITSLQGNVNLTLRNDGVLSYTTPNTLTFGNVLITNASLVISNSSYPVIINANNIFLQNGGRISADRAGYAQGAGPGAGKVGQAYVYAGSGGGNGGDGGSAISNSVSGGGGGYGSYYAPIQPGSGGGGESPYSVGGTGGGVIELNITGTLAVNGTLSANGGNGGGSAGGGGAGGSLQLEIGSLTGSGMISANGGNGVDGTGGGGGGGAIGVIFEQSTFSNLFTGTMTAYGGGGWTNGGAGTIFIKTNNTGQATLIVDNGGNLGTNTPITTSSSLYSITVRNGGIAALPDSSESFSSLLITSNAWMVPIVAQQGALGEVYLTLQGNATIQAGGGIIANSDGYAQNNGSGHGSSETVSPTYPCSGGGHGGDGAFSVSNLVAGGSTYDTITAPTGYGSGGGGTETFSTGGSGGGNVYLNLIDSGVLQVNGLISANGGNGSGIGGGGGSGGTISLSAGIINGTGSITANGGAGALNGGGGGGGCIALLTGGKVVPLEIGTNFFRGTISAYGGGGANDGGAGTLFYETNNSIGLPVGGRNAELYVDNGGNVGTNTTLNVSEINVVIQNGGIGAIPVSVWTEGDVLVLSNSELTSLVGQTTVDPTSLTIAAGGVFSVDGVGYAAQTGPGAGSASGGISGGGGHGGYGGGNAPNPIAPGGNAYDSIQTPTLQGSGGANSSTGSGGAGGGELAVRTLQGLVVNGRISANGRPGGLNAGGGAGGSISLSATVGTVSGNGIISANGGAGSDSGGGGAGGRIAIPAGSFSGQLSAVGGAGGSPGGAGTVWTLTGGQKLIVNNGGEVGAGTPLSTAFALPSSPFELDISGGASVLPLTPLPLLSNLNVLASSTLTTPIVESNFFISVMGNATIGGDLNADYVGYTHDIGPGAGVAIDNEGSGGGYGGVGGASDSGAPGGMTYGSAVHPTDFGSGGGNGVDTTSGGSQGGGALRLSVTGTLNVNGNISANGDTGLQDDSGGGSGGSVWITAGTLSGAGTISAAGGDGVLYGGGGGGGGRVAIDTLTNQFTGTTNVSGGLGIFSGQAGTVSLASALSGLQILSQSPTGSVANTVSSVNLTFSDMLNAGSVSTSDFTVVTPAGALSQTSLIVLITSPYAVQLNFPTQNLLGTYTVQAGTGISDVFGASLAPFAGTFTVSIPAISGTVTDTNGAGVAGVSIQPGGGLIAATTDSNGNYSLGVPPGWTGTVTPSFGTYVFLPPSMSYTNVTGSLTNQNYSMVQTISPALTTSLSAGSCCLNWTGMSGVTYQMLWSTNLVTWQPLGSPIAGTNGPMQIMVPSGTNCAGFFQLQASP